MIPPKYSVLQIMLSFDFGAEWPKRESCDLKKLFSERYSYDRYTEDESGYEIPESQFHSAENKPYDVKEKRAGAATVSDLLAERVKRNTRELKALKSDRDPDNSYAIQQSCDDPSEEAE